MFLPDQLYDKKSVAKTMAISVPFVDKLMKSGVLLYIKIGTAVRFRGSDLNKFLA